MTRFPLHPVRDGVCTCHEGAECERPGKHPMVLWGSLEKGENVEGPEGCGYGLATGARSDCFVVDCDTPESVALFLGCNPPPTRTVRTPRGGAHFYFQWPGWAVRCSQKEIDADVDIRGDGGFVVLPGSAHRNGGSYVLAEGTEEIAPAPEWLLSWDGLRRRERVSPEGTLEPVDVATPEGIEALEEARAYLATVAPCIEGKGGDMHLWYVALRLMRTLRLPLEVAFEELAPFNARCEPPWDTNILRRKLEEARDHAERPPGEWLRPSFVARLVAKSEAARIVPPREEAPPRRKKNPAHKHTYEVTTLAPNPMISKGRLTDVITYLSTDAWEGVLQYDAFAGHPLAVDPPIALRAEQGTLAQSDATSVRALLEHQGIAVGKDLAFDALEAVCYANKFDPLKEHILALPPGDPKILEGLAARLFGATEHIEEVFFRKFLMGSIARALVPGCKFDEMLILSGEGGARKSTFAEVLCQEIAWFCDALPALDTDNVIRQLQGKWIVEVAELAATKRSDIETQKAFTSRRSDRFTQKYERHAEDHPRRCVFLGTTNDQEILFDTNGNRRYWCIEVRLAEIPIDWFREHRDQILAAARDLYLSGEPLYLSPEEKVLAREQTHQFEVSDTWTEKLAEYCAGKDEVKVSRALAFLGVPIERQGVAEQRRVGGCLRMLGCSRKVNRGTQGTRLRVWVPPDELRAAKPSGAVVAFDRQPG